MPGHPPCIFNFPSLPAHSHHHSIRLEFPSSLTITLTLNPLSTSRLPPFSFLPLETSWKRCLILHFRIPIIWRHCTVTNVSLKVKTNGNFWPSSCSNSPQQLANGTVGHFICFLETLILASQTPPSPDFPSTTLALLTQFPFLFPSGVFHPLSELPLPSQCWWLSRVHLPALDVCEPWIFTST